MSIPTAVRIADINALLRARGTNATVAQTQVALREIALCAEDTGQHVLAQWCADMATHFVGGSVSPNAGEEYRRWIGCMRRAAAKFDPGTDGANLCLLVERALAPWEGAT